MKLFFLLLTLLSGPSFGQVKSDDVGKLVSTLEVVSTGPSIKNCDRSIRNGSLTNNKGVNFNVSVISEDYAEELFRYLASQELSYKYSQDGCYARAHMMARLLDKLGITCGKAFIEGNLKVKSDTAPSGEVSWWYHVAPVLKVRKNGKDEVYVFDPSLFNRPVPIQEWHDIQTREEKKTYYTPRYNYMPEDRDVLLNDYQEEDFMNATEVLRVYSDVLKSKPH